MPVFLSLDTSLGRGMEAMIMTNIFESIPPETGVVPAEANCLSHLSAWCIGRNLAFSAPDGILVWRGDEPTKTHEHQMTKPKANTVNIQS
jgi:hypothetical protein